MERTVIWYSRQGNEFLHTECLIECTVYGTMGGSLQLMSTAGQLLLC